MNDLKLFTISIWFWFGLWLELGNEWIAYLSQAYVSVQGDWIVEARL